MDHPEFITCSFMNNSIGLKKGLEINGRDNVRFREIISVIIEAIEFVMF